MGDLLGGEFRLASKFHAARPRAAFTPARVRSAWRKLSRSKVKGCGSAARGAFLEGPSSEEPKGALSLARSRARPAGFKEMTYFFFDLLLCLSRCAVSLRSTFEKCLCADVRPRSHPREVWKLLPTCRRPSAGPHRRSGESLRSGRRR
jgi:hypothetical protein